MEDLDMDFFNLSDDVFNYEPSAGYETRRLLIVIVSSFLIVLGTLGNILSGTVFLQKEMRAVPAYFTFVIVAVADTAMLIYSLGNDWLHLAVHVDLPSKAGWYCVAFNVMNSALTDVANLLPIIIAVAHSFSLCCCQQETRRINSQRTVWCQFPRIFLWVAILVFLCVIDNLYVGRSVHMDVWYPEKRLVCFRHFDFIMHVIKPSVQILAVFIVLCVLSCQLCNKHNIQRSSQVPISGVQTDTEALQEAEVNDVASHLTSTIIALCIFFLLTNVPVTVVTLLATLLYHDYNIISALALLLWYSSFALKFLVYSATAHDFRRHFLVLISMQPRRSESREAIAMIDT